MDISQHETILGMWHDDCDASAEDSKSESMKKNDNDECSQENFSSSLYFHVVKLFMQYMSRMKVECKRYKRFIHEITTKYVM